MSARPMLLAGLAVLAACSEPAGQPRDALNLERPVDVAFACHGGLRITNGAPADPTQPVVASAMPTTACATRSLPDDDMDPDANIPPGQEPLGMGSDPIGIQGYAFVLQSVPGTVGVARFPNQPWYDYEGGEVVVLDTDALTPGKNGISVGSLPVAIATDEAGCHVATANAGSCDLSILDVSSVLAQTPAPIVNRVAVTDGAGAPVLAKPAAMLAGPPDATTPIGVACPAAPTGLFYVAYPSCHVVAAIDGTGRIVQHIAFAPDGTATVVDDGNVSCPVECGDARTSPVPGPRPVTLDLVFDQRIGTRKLAIGADDLARVTVVELDDDNRFTPVVEQVALEGAVGVLDVAISPQIGMGGVDAEVRNDAIATGGQFQFVYAVATDGTVRVAEVLDLDRECDTQIDPRFIHDEINIGLLGCLPIGDPTLPRRAGARGPGIELHPDYFPPQNPSFPDARPTEVVANGVTIFGVDLDDPENPPPGDPLPRAMVGYFALITASNGDVFVANLDDDKYGDRENLPVPHEVAMPLAIAHQIRDAIPNRHFRPFTSTDPPEPLCSSHGARHDDPATDAGPPRLAEDIGRFLNTSFIAGSKGYALPSIRALACTGADETRAVSELSFAAAPEVLELSYPDLAALDKHELWTLVWEGSLSLDGDFADIDGPGVRLGLVEVDGTGMRVEDASHPYCAMGVEPHDVVQLRGCDPALGDNQCPNGHTCYVHPDQEVSAGACIKTELVDTLAAPCREFFLSLRRYSVAAAESGELRLVERPRALRTTPLTGCTGDAHCDLLADAEVALASDEQPGLEPPAPELTWSCRPDPTRNGTQNRCVLTCDPAGDSSDCDAGTVCNAAGVCVEGIVPPLQCVEAVQRYEVRAGDAFTVIGSAHGYQHSIIEDPATEACVRDPAAHPLMVGRIPLTAPPCTGDSRTDLLPNPCEVTVDHTYAQPRYNPGTCDAADPASELVTEPVTAIRFQNPQLRFHLVTPTYPGDLVCKGDRMGTLGDIPTVFTGLKYEINQVDGILPLRVEVGATFPTRVVRGPQNSLWIVDEGDGLTGSTTTLGKVYRVEAGALGVGSTLQ